MTLVGNLQFKTIPIPPVPPLAQSLPATLIIQRFSVFNPVFFQTLKHPPCMNRERSKSTPRLQIRLLPIEHLQGVVFHLYVYAKLLRLSCRSMQFRVIV